LAAGTAVSGDSDSDGRVRAVGASIALLYPPGQDLTR